MKDPVMNTIIDYIKTPNTEHAVMIRGQWGSGKTYYWTYVLKEEIEKYKAAKHIKYLSLYGIKNEEELKANIFFKFANKNRIQRKRILSTGMQSLMIGSMRYFNLTNKEISLKPSRFVDINQTVLCIDDLERSKIPIVNVLGLLDQLLIDNDIKIIILSNEEKILLGLKKKQKEYQEYKEKVIGKTIELQQENEMIVREFINAYYVTEEENTWEYYLFNDLKYMENGINVYLEHTNTFNYRALRQSLDDTCSLYKQIGSRELKKMGEDYRRYLIANIIQLSFAQKIGGLNLNSIEKTNNSHQISEQFNTLIEEMEKDDKNVKKYFYSLSSSLARYEIPIMVFYLVGHGELNEEKIQEETTTLIERKRNDDSLYERINYPEHIKTDMGMITTALLIVNYLNHGMLPLNRFKNAFLIIKELNELNIFNAFEDWNKILETFEGSSVKPNDRENQITALKKDIDTLKTFKDSASVYNFFENSLKIMPASMFKQEHMIIIDRDSDDQMVYKLESKIKQIRKDKNNEYNKQEALEWLTKMEKDHEEVIYWLDNYGGVAKFDLPAEAFANIVYQYEDAYKLGVVQSKVATHIEMAKSNNEITIKWWRNFHSLLKKKLNNDPKNKNYSKLLRLQFFVKHIEKFFD